ncbi:hypothetical protein AC1031_011281 [Aphanomyces cochlioides]|nr:hypothetical protein AC1031_011281 [Aphanomyces cochlioides]
MPWLRDHVQPITEQHWTLHAFTPFSSWNDMSSFRITRLTIEVAWGGNKDPVVAILPSLHHLRALKMTFDNPAEHTSSVLAFAAKSDQLVELELHYDGDEEYVWISDAMIRNVLERFQRRPVHTFLIESWDIQAEDTNLKQAFFEALFNCPTIEKLVCHDTPMGGVNFANCTFSMRSLEISLVDSTTLEKMANQLIGSNVMDLTLYSRYDQDIAGTQLLFEILPRTAIETLNLSYSHYDTPHWQILAPLLAQSQLKTLILQENDLESAEIDIIARAIQSNNSLVAIDVSLNIIDFKGMQKLIECATDPRRNAQMKLIAVGGNGLSEEDLGLLTELAARRGGERLKTTIGHDKEEEGI